jgi:predicted TIM-barrel fold metal-dependent hydrolase
VNEEVVKIAANFTVDIDYTGEKLSQDLEETGIDKAVVVGYPINDWTDNSYTIEVVEAFQNLTGVVMLDVFADDADTRLRDYMAHDGILGFRLGVQFPHEYESMWTDFNSDVTWLRDAIDEVPDVWEAARETNALVQLFVHHSQLDQVQELVESYPDLTYAIDHWAHADPSDEIGEGSFAGLGELAGYENVAVKVSETPYVSNEPFPYPDVHDHLQWLLDTYGRDRIIWGSDFPNVSNPRFGGATYSDAFNWIMHLEGLSNEDLDWLTKRAFKNHIDW